MSFGVNTLIFSELIFAGAGYGLAKIKRAAPIATDGFWVVHDTNIYLSGGWKFIKLIDS